MALCEYAKENGWTDGWTDRSCVERAPENIPNEHLVPQYLELSLFLSPLTLHLDAPRDSSTYALNRFEQKGRTSTSSMAGEKK